MIDSLRRSLSNLRDALSAANSSAIELHAPPGLRRLLKRSTRLLDAVLRAAIALGPQAFLREANSIHPALTQAREALLAWHAWMEGVRPSEA
ncbi:MAG TPA: hypothetical protein VKN99_02180 [Polyangia bacterium]|nr:hypothetical protein [Polyangia bacterium]